MKNKVFEAHPLLDPTKIEKISGWKPWKPKPNNFNASEQSYQKYLEMEAKLISDQELSKSEGDPWETIHKTRKHLAEAASKFANQVDFLAWVKRTVNNASEDQLND